MMLEDMPQILRNSIKKDERSKSRMQDEALAIVTKQSIDESPFAIALFDESWHEGIVGIVAGKVKRRLPMPLCCLCKIWQTIERLH